MRRPRVEWMTRSDDAILEFLRNEPGRPIRATPRVIECNIDFSISTVRGRLGELLDHGLVQYFDDELGIYEISQLGCRYLDGDVSKSEIS